jgi:hypothetical protein
MRVSGTSVAQLPGSVIQHVLPSLKNISSNKIDILPIDGIEAASKQSLYRDLLEL